MRLLDRLESANRARLQRMYVGAKGNAAARRFAKTWAWAFAHSPVATRWVTLEVPGRTSGKPTRFPIGLADVDRQWYVVSMLGRRCNLAKNVAAADGLALLDGRYAARVRLVDVPVTDRPRILKRYLTVANGGRPHIPVDYREPVAAFEAVAADFPVWRVELIDGRLPTARH